MPRYDARRIESKWQQFWDDSQTFRTSQELSAKEKFYVLGMFPYPSGNGLHVGHPEGYTATDIMARYMRMLGKNVLNPMGWDSFGLPAEQHAIRTGQHPRETTETNINTFRRQLKMLGFSYDWEREVATSDPDYFHWTQWIFLELFDTWYDAELEWTGPDGNSHTGKGRPISELPIPAEIQQQGAKAVRRYQDQHRLAYQHEAPVNWCPALGTVLSNEEIIDGKSERGSHPVERIPLRQWMLRITAYGDRLLNDLQSLDWSDSIKLLQQNWIGRSEGAEVDFYVGDGTGDLEAGFAKWKSSRAGKPFPISSGGDVLRVYTTRPDTLYGATYMVMAPEHPFVDRLTSADQKSAVSDYRKQAALKSDLDRTDLAKGKSGVFTGAYAINPVNGAQIPIWIADYVLISYGTGAIMAVPAHDLRDWEFAVTFDIPIIPVVEAPAGYEHSREELALKQSIDGEERAPFAGQGRAINSGEYTGLATADFKSQITDILSNAGLGKKAVNYRLRDWLFSRQHYWGEPFPIWHELDDNGKPTGLMRTDEPGDLPIRLPENFEFKHFGTPEPPLSRANEGWLYRQAEDGTQLKRETNSMPQWAGSCWYYLRYIDPKNETCFVDPDLEKYWMSVDLYIGGVEHAVLHLLYARFWHKVLFDRGYLSTAEPFQKLVNQGMILGEAEQTGYQDADGNWVSASDVTECDDTSAAHTHVHKTTNAPVNAVSLKADDVEKKGESFVLKSDPAIVVDSRAHKMSKSRGNVINPDVVVDQYGADSLRLYEMFMGPLEQTKPWNMQGVEGVSRFLGRVWRMFVDERADAVQLNEVVKEEQPTDDQLRILHKTIKAVTEDIEKLSFNTAISRMMEFTNAISPLETRPKSILQPFVLLLAPFAPHIAEELWQLLGHKTSLTYETWPEHDENLISESTVELPVQVNGKMRAKISVPADADQATIQSCATEDSNVQSHLEGKTVVKVIVVPNRMVNFVVK